MMKLAIYLGFILLATVLLGGCGLLEQDQRTDIVWLEEDLSDYVVITYNKQRDFEKIGVIDPVTGEILDTFDGFAGEDYVVDIVPTPDGRHLYVSMTPNRIRVSNSKGAVYKVNVLTWEIKEVYQEATFLKRGHDHEIYFITSPDSTGSNRSFGRIDQTSDSFIELTNLSIGFPEMSDQSLAYDVDRNHNLVYYIDEEQRLNRKNYETGEHSYLFEEYNEYLKPKYMHISYGGDFLFFSNGLVIDLRKGEIINSIPSTYHRYIVSRKDGKEVYFSDPIAPLFSRFPKDPTGKITVYNTEGNREMNSFYLFHESGQPVWSNIAHLTFNERYMVVGGRGCGFTTVDLKTREKISFHCYRDTFPDLQPFYLLLTRRVHELNQ